MPQTILVLSFGMKLPLQSAAKAVIATPCCVNAEDTTGLSREIAQLITAAILFCAGPAHELRVL
jgi:hypothetical protein